MTVLQNRIYCTGDPNYVRGGNTPHGIIVNNESNFCNVMLQMYGHMVARQRGEMTKAMSALKLALSDAQTGMAAWPEDSTRERFYVNFFADAQRWAQARQ